MGPPKHVWASGFPNQGIGRPGATHFPGQGTT
jgi:hypothetical protein